LMKTSFLLCGFEPAKIPGTRVAHYVATATLLLVLSPVSSVVAGTTPPEGQSQCIGTSSEIQILPVPPDEFSTRVLWQSEDPSRPLFYPATLIRGQGDYATSLDAATAIDIEKAVARQRARGRIDIPGDCFNVSDDGIASQSTPGGRTVPQLLEEREFAAAGKVLALVPGWSYGRIQTMVYLEVEEVLYCNGKVQDSAVGSIGKGSIVATFYDLGRYEIDGVELCSQSQLGLQLPEAGRRAIIGGRVPDVAQPEFIGGYAVLFPLDEDKVLPQPYEDFEWQPMNYSALREALGDSPLSCGEKN
jgi:hypothetical protein